MFIFYIYHKIVKYFMSTKVQNLQQAYQNILLSRFNFVITYHLNSQQIWSNALLKRAYLASKEEDITYNQQRLTIFKLE